MQNDNHHEQLDNLCQKLDEVLSEGNTENATPTFRLLAISKSLDIIAKNLQHAIYNHNRIVPTESIPPHHNEPTIPQQLHAYILNHLDEPLPSTKALARRFLTNQRKLKEGFKNEYNTSIYNFFNGQRLEKAKIEIIHTHKSIKEIAADHGFNTYHAFYCAFAKYFGHAPTNLRTNNK